MKITAVVTSENELFADFSMDEGIQGKIVELIPEQKFQKHLGFGGAFTESASFVFNQLTLQLQEEVLEAYFGATGLSYNLGRLTIGSCDFSLAPYDYIKNDDIATFSLNHDEETIFMFVRRALEKNSLSLMASSWSPVAFMKDNGTKMHGGHLIDSQYALYARYLMNYIKEARQRGMPVERMTIQNEPAATQVWESCLFTPAQEMNLLKHLKLEQKKQGIDNIKFLVWDHNRDVLKERVDSYHQADNFEMIDGVAYHWYDNTKSEQLDDVHRYLPEKEIIFSEGCIELLLLSDENGRKPIGTLKNGLRYARNYINDSLHYSNGFIDWNLLLFSNGGPNHVGNFCEAPIMYDEKAKKLSYNVSYYVIKHFAYFIKPNARRIGLKNPTDCLITAYQNAEGSLVAIILNETKNQKLTIQFGNCHLSWYSKKNSLVTLCIRK